MWTNYIIKENRVRGKRTVKAYRALFICFCTKELVSDPSSDVFLNAFRRRGRELEELIGELDLEVLNRPSGA